MTLKQWRHCCRGYQERWNEYQEIHDTLNYHLGIYIAHAFSGKKYPNKPFYSKNRGGSGMIQGDDAIEAYINSRAEAQNQKETN